MDYEKLLDQAYKELPESAKGDQRFEVDKVRGHVEGNRTIISNIKQIAKKLERDPAHLIKYLLKELATPAKMKRDFLVLNAKIPASRINKKIREYMSDFVVCQECGKPDTVLTLEKNIAYIRCNACGAKHNVKNL